MRWIAFVPSFTNSPGKGDFVRSSSLRPYSLKALMQPAFVIALAAISIAATAAASEPTTGHLTLTFTEPSPLSAPDQTARRFRIDPRRWSGPPATQKAEPDLASQTFAVFIPQGYTATNPHGILAWMGVTDF